jgi:hypothetical protein
MMRGSIVVVLLFAASPTLAQETAQCTPIGDLIARNTAPDVFVVSGTDRVHFLKTDWDEAGCPASGKLCLLKAYVVPGDAVIVTSETADFLCATFTGPAPDHAVTDGWLPRAALKRLARVPVADWVGEWAYGEFHQLSITAGEGGSIAIDGSALFGAEDPQRVANGAVNMGDLSGDVVPDGDSVAFSLKPEGDIAGFNDDPSDGYRCRVKLWRLGPYLVASDNVSCGGANVTFTGVYRD